MYSFSYHVFIDSCVVWKNKNCFGKMQEMLKITKKRGGWSFVSKLAKWLYLHWNLLLSSDIWIFTFMNFISSQSRAIPFSSAYCGEKFHFSTQLSPAKFQAWVIYPSEVNSIKVSSFCTLLLFFVPKLAINFRKALTCLCAFATVTEAVQRKQLGEKVSKTFD